MPNHLAGDGQAAGVALAFGQAEVGDPRMAVGVEQDVRRFQIAMDDSFAVGIMHRQGHVADDAWRLRAAAAVRRPAAVPGFLPPRSPSRSNAAAWCWPTSKIGTMLG